MKHEVFVKKNAPYTPPAYLLQALARLDNGRLRLRWSEEHEKWCLERKALRAIDYITHLPHYKKRRLPSGAVAVVENDSWVRARDGYILIGYYDPQPQLGEWVIRNLQFYDIRRLGGWKEVDLLLTRQEEQRQRSQDRQRYWELYELSEDFYESEVWRQGERIAVPRQYEQVGH